MEVLKDRRVVLALVGGAVALAAGVMIALALTSGGRGSKAPPPASQGGLIVETRQPDDKLDSARPLRCFVAGQFVGELTLAECAERNGVATGALDVGVDETGALAAADQAGTNLTPLPPAEAEPAAPAPAQPETGGYAEAGPAGGCWRYAGDWRRLPGDMTLNACVQALFAGRCERAGQATYGRWMQQTLRLVPGRVEVSGDNRSFRTLAEQGPGCAIAPIG
ncbi:MAG: hypothetical protein ACK4YQ_08950 [Phenylobacterium sp.]|uniref:hypothetical protein n=1 Tax=Phenylobacterium sp. TaxID=1871053 RepID=UPI00391D3206